MDKAATSIFVRLVQKIPISWRIKLTRSSAANWLRRLTLLPLAHGLVVVDLSGPLVGYHMRLDMRAGHRRYALGTYEPEVAALIQSTLRGGETVMDIGANVGYFTLLLAHRVGSAGRVIAFEPLPSVYAVLCENLRLNGLTWVEAEYRAVSDHDGETRMRSESSEPLPFTARLAEDGDLVVPTVSIDRYVEVNQIPRLDFVKIDVEGAEDAVIRGMNATLQKFRPVILIEVHANNGQESEGLLRLQEAGYRLTRVDPAGLSPCDTLSRGGHVLAR